MPSLACTNRTQLAASSKTTSGTAGATSCEMPLVVTSESLVPGAQCFNALARGAAPISANLSTAAGRVLKGVPSMRAKPTVEALNPYVAPLEGRRGLLRLTSTKTSLGPSPKVVEAIRALPPEYYANLPRVRVAHDALRRAHRPGG